MGWDLIPPRALISGASELAVPLANLFNICIEQGHWPTDWKKGEWTPVHKKDNQLQKENYRPVTVQIVINKIFEQLLSSQITGNYNNRLCDHLTAYRKRNSCETTLLYLTESWRHSLDNGECVGVLSTDMSKAFVCLFPPLMLAKLRAYSFDDVSLKLMASYFENRKARVKLGNTTSRWRKMGLYIQLAKSGNAERFYAAFYASIVLHASSHFVGLSRNSATLLCSKVADCLLTHSKEKAETHTCEPLTKLSDKEKSGLQYIGGYVLHKLHNKHKQASKTLENDHAISLIMAGKWDNPIGEDQRLTTTLNRGGLWKITRNAQSVFERTEHYFREATRKTSLKNIPLANIISRSMHDVTVVASHSAMLADSEVEISSHVAKDVLHNIISLYVRVRSFSFVKDVIQKHKIRLKQLKSKALRKDINRSSTD
ncbi:hypothetical protein AWC38_SpisGene18314 [Stylophora pistillata]|uniref:Uncharacterized protein n=1 Tax=Stylophora pistillata TaxID=50429 RepID=A0A2B4RIE5_STYPI|nr:hypothetical protein AWC38_SpisGene18314 [Stylophora pistillata]